MTRKLDLEDEEIYEIIDALKYWRDEASIDVDELIERLGGCDDYEYSLPMQPIEFDEHGTIRFKKNSLVDFLLENGPNDMNTLAALPGVTKDERMQFAQLIGYSVSGFGDLSYAHRKVVQEADIAADNLAKENE